MNTLTDKERAARYVAKIAGAVSGERGHDFTYHVAATIWNGFALCQSDTLDVLLPWNARCVPPWTEGELVHKINAVASAQHRDPRGYLLEKQGSASPRPSHPAERVVAPPPPPKPAFCPMVLRRIAAKVPGVVDVVAFLSDRSPVAVNEQDSAGVLRWLYPAGSGEKVVIFSDMKSQGQLLWEADKAELISNERLPTGADGVWFLPQPVDGGYHANPRLGGKMSRRSEEAVTSWRHLVVESDEADRDEWLRCMIQLPLRIVSICESGARSIHALVRVDAASKADWDAKVRVIKPVLVTLGADPGALTAVRLTRLPQAQRGERVQRLLYLNPAPDVRAVLALPSWGGRRAG